MPRPRHQNRCTTFGQAEHASFAHGRFDERLSARATTPPTVQDTARATKASAVPPSPRVMLFRVTGVGPMSWPRITGGRFRQASLFQA